MLVEKLVKRLVEELVKKVIRGSLKSSPRSFQIVEFAECKQNVNTLKHDKHCFQFQCLMVTYSVA